VAYVALRTALTRLVADKSGVRAVADSPYNQSPARHFSARARSGGRCRSCWRAGDTALLAGATWDELLVAGRWPMPRRIARLEDWAAVHRTDPAPSAVGDLSGACTVARQSPADRSAATTIRPFATGYNRAGSACAPPMQRCRANVFDVGAWDNCQWIVFHGASGHTGSPDLRQPECDLGPPGKMVPMLYDWNKIEACATSHQQLLPS